MVVIFLALYSFIWGKKKDIEKEKKYIDFAESQRYIYTHVCVYTRTRARGCVLNMFMFMFNHF